MKHYFPIIGFVSLVLVIIVLFSTTDLIFRSQVSFISTETGSLASRHGTPVLTKMDFANNEQVQAFATSIGTWSAEVDYEASRFEELLNANVLLMRAYTSGDPGIYQPVFLLILQSSDPISFHGVKTCYRALGYDIDEEVLDEIEISDASWAETPETSLPVNRLIIAKRSGETVTERRLVLFFYIKDSSWTKDVYTLIRVSTVIPKTGSYDGILGIARDFMSQIIPYMFEPKTKDDPMVIVALARAGIGGYFLIVLMCGVPLGFFAYPWIRPRSALNDEVSPDNQN